MKTNFHLRLICVLLALTCLCGCSAVPSLALMSTSSFNAADRQTSNDSSAVPDSPVMTAEDITTYYFNLEPENTDSTTLYFKNGNRQVPYFDVETVKDLMIMILGEGNSLTSPPDTPAYDLTLSEDGATVIFTRENSYSMIADFDNDTISFDDYDKFINQPYTITTADILVLTGYDNENRPCLLQRVKEHSYDRYGEIWVLDLSKYGIDLVYSDGKYYMPVQTVADVLLSGYFFLYNTKELFITNADEAIAYRKGTPSKILERYYAVSIDKRSQELIDYTYNELCFVMDTFYGLKDVHDISTFDDLFTRLAVNGAPMKDMLLSEDPRDADFALAQLMMRDLDDNHSYYLLPSAYTGEDSSIIQEVQIGNSYQQYDSLAVLYQAARAKAYPDGIPGYEEIGNTAYITFDHFTLSTDFADIYSNFPTAEDAEQGDTIPLLVYAHSRITREGSPIENVVIDLSCNSGGVADTAVYVCSWFLGETSLFIENENTGANACTAYRADLNLDRKFDEDDTLGDLNLYCLISPASFSCGNLVPNLFASSNRVTLVGQTSGGGTCCVLPLTTASGSMFRTSSSYSVSTVKNGAFYNVDQGANPDIALTSPESFYDRVTLTAYLNSHL